MNTIVISGANGFIGNYLVRHFVAKGWSVIALVRTPPALPMKGVEYRLYDMLLEPATDLLQGADCFIHAAYLPNDFGRNVAAAEQLLMLSRKFGIRRNVFISSFSSSADAVSLYGKQKHAVEQFFNSDKDAIVRPGTVLGDGGLFERMSTHIKKGGRVPMIEGGRQPLQTVAVDDLCMAIEKILVNGLAGSFNVAETESLTYKEFFMILASLHGVKVRFIPMPYRLLDSLLQLTEGLGISLPVGRENLRGLKALRYHETKTDLQRLGIVVKDCKTSLEALFKNNR